MSRKTKLHRTQPRPESSGREEEIPSPHGPSSNARTHSEQGRGAYLRPARISGGTTGRGFVCRKNSSLYGRPSSAGGLIAQKNRNVQVGHSCLFHTNQKLFPMRAMGPMRVARLINKRYNHNGKQNSTAAAGSANSPPPATGDTTARSSRNSAPQGYYTHFAPPRQENLPHCTGLL